MAVQYNGEHSITFFVDNGGYSLEGPYRTWVDWHLIPKTRPFITIPAANYTIASIPNSSDRINITEFIPGGQTYGPRQGSWEFFIDHDQWGSWIESRDALVQTIHGKHVYLCLDDDPLTVYEGRVSIGGRSPGEDYSSVTINYDLNYEISDVRLAYQIRWFNHDGTLLGVSYSQSGAYTTYGTNMTVPPVHKKGSAYQFIGWSPTPYIVTGHQDYTAVYRRRTDIIRLENEKGKTSGEYASVPSGVTLNTTS